MSADFDQAIAAAYATEGAALDLGRGVLDGTVHRDAAVRVPLATLNRHGLVAGATGTGKTKTLQLMTEQLSAAGVPVSSPTSRATSPACRSPARRAARPRSG